MAIRAVWWAMLLWLAVGLVVALSFLASWLSGAGNPLRHEAAMGITMSVAYATPAMLGAMIFSTRSVAEEASTERLATKVLCTGLLLVFAFSLVA
jgi:hypothetical protein